ncbi:MAG TPA: ribosome small subunit-dependent GTPase A [Arthrobacter sp.]|nr:ribosome small subunit-dependent GTPase A [Arthrobacter sp.]
MQTSLAPFGYTDRIEQLYQSNFEQPCPARVVRVDKNRVLLATTEGPLHVAFPRLEEQCATGDWVQLSVNSENEPAITAVLERFSLLARKKAHDPLSSAQVLAANIDVVGVVVPIDRPISHNRLERTLVAAWDSGGTPLVILTKADLSNGNDDVVSQVIDQAAGVDVVTTSAELGDGLEELMLHVIPGQTLVLLGPSGAGKSTLINALAGQHLQDTGDVRAVDGRGKHTTTARELIPLPNGAVLMDTPGVRGFALWESDAGMEAVFGDIEALFADCRFQDCRHGPEPDCAIQAALAAGTLELRRWKSYLKLQRELARLDRQHDEVAKRQYGREWSKIVKAQAKARRQPSPRG